MPLDSSASESRIQLFASCKQNHPEACFECVRREHDRSNNPDDHLGLPRNSPGDHSRLSGVHRLSCFLGGRQ